MCGIGGILRVWPAGVEPPPPEVSIPEAWLDALDESIKHRGPDGAGRFRDRAVRADGVVIDVGLVHRRLSIIDLEGGGQPMVSEGAGGRVAVVFNGCIYNHAALRKELAGLGHVFVTDHSDTEVLVHGWRAWGTGLVDRLEGMFAMLVWDGAAGTLLAARDTFGEKPLATHHVACGSSWVNVFSSTAAGASAIGVLVGTSDAPIENRSKAIDWLRFGFGPAAPLCGAGAIVPGQWVVYDALGEPHTHANGMFREPRTSAAGVLARDGKRALPSRVHIVTEEEVESSLRQAVDACLASDVEVGSFLSGGVDSSLISLFAKQSLGRLRTFTIKMPGALYDESGYAAEAARIVGSEHETVECGENVGADLVELIEEMGLPFGDSSLLATMWVSRAARAKVKVALSGDGGDELFAGYERFRVAGLFPFSVPFAGVLGSAVAGGAAPGSLRAKLGRFADAAANLGYWDLLALFPQSMLREVVADARVADESARWLDSCRVRSPEEAIGMDLLAYLPLDLLRKTDHASMHVALEVRCPMLHPHLATLALGARMDSLMPGGQRKLLLRNLAKKYFDASLIDRRKQGFAIPVGEWFRSDYGSMKTLLLDMLHSADPYPAELLGFEINRRFVDQMIDEHMAQRRDHSQRLYMMLVLAIWTRWVRGLKRAGM
jgi:asparagine synthase (glutamine-hydrolysing)